jgi:hypothetical protein
MKAVIVDADKTEDVRKFKTLDNGFKIFYDEDMDLAFIHKENVAGLLGLDKDKASSWKEIFELFDEAANEYYEVSGDYTYSIGYSTNEYLDKRSKYTDKNSIPSLLRKYEYFNEKIVDLMLLKANTKKGKKFRVATIMTKPSKYANCFIRKMYF